jgi:hypothetical protein
MTGYDSTGIPVPNGSNCAISHTPSRWVYFVTPILGAPNISIIVLVKQEALLSTCSSHSISLLSLERTVYSLS